MIIREIRSNEKKVWDLFVSVHPAGHFMQSYAWGDVKSKSGWLPIRLFVQDHGKTKAAIQILKKKLPLTRRCIFYAPRGPVADYRDHGTLDFLFGEVRRIARGHRAIFFLIDPAVPDEDAALKEYLNRQGFVFSDRYGIVGLTLPKRVFHLDLSQSEDELMANMGKTHRRNIHRSQIEGVTVERRSNEEGLRVFYHLFKEMSKRKKFLIRSFNYQRSLLKAFCPDNNFELFLAMYKGRVVAGHVILQYGNKAWDMYGVSDTSYTQLNASYLVIWKAIMAMKARGCTLFDFRGADSKDPASPLHGIHMFKKGFGPQYIEYVGEYYCVFSRFYFTLVNLARFCLKRALKIYKELRAFDLLAAINKLFRYSVDEESLRNTVIEKYGQKEELAAHSEILKLGLLDAEDRAVTKYFRKGNQVLDIGCGAGREAIALIKKGFQVTGVDLHPKMIEASIRNAKDHKAQGCFEVMDACQMAFEDDSFDQIVMFGSLISYIPRKENRIAALKEAKRVLKKGGHIILSVPNRMCHVKYLAYFSVVNVWRALCKKIIRDYPLEANDRFGKKVSLGKSKGSVYFHMYSLDEMAEDISNAGLKMVDCRSNNELTRDINAPQEREKDYFLYFIVQKEN